MKLKEDSSEKKLRGAYYTPLLLSDAMVRLFAKNEIANVLEPSCGDGVFLDSLVNLGFIKRIEKIDAIEIEPEESAKVRKKFMNEKRIDVYTEDFFDYYSRMYGKRYYDLILGNPPYIRYQYLSEKQRILQSNILTAHGMKSNKLINAWVAFIVAAVQMLSQNGKIAFVIPAEILQVAYAEDLRLYLSNNLAKITLITFEQLVFPDIEQEVVVFIGEKGEEEKGIRIIEMHDLSDFEKLQLDQNGFQKLQHVKEKWTKYFISEKEMGLINRIRNDERFIKFSECGLINVGITTGNNSYFSVTEKEVAEFELEDITLPLIGRSSHAHGVYFTKEDWDNNKKEGKRARLVSFPDIPYDCYKEGHKKYIEFGVRTGKNKGYKCAIRDKWYIVPSIWVPDAFFLRRNNLYPKFVLNKCKAVSTDTMHRMKFNKDINPEDVLLAYYNSISFAFTEICGRSYGGGVLEILPGEMGNVILPKIRNIDKKLRQSLLEYIDTIVRSNADIEIALDVVDKKLLIDTLGIEPELCKQCRSIWKKLQKRRLGRGM